MNVIFIGRSTMTSNKKDTKKYHDWVYMADDQINHVLKWVIIFIYACAAIAIASDLLSKFL